MSRRALLGVGIVVAWLAGIVVLVNREYFRPQLEQMAEAALRVSPGVVYYGVMQGSRQIGFASSTIDTAASTITVNDYLVADLPFGGRTRRTSARANITLSRGLRIRNFELALELESGPLRATGRVDGDSVLVLIIKSGTEQAETERIALSGPILIPTLIPLAVALGQPPKVNKRYVLPVFDVTTMKPKDVAVNVRAESVFVVNDSAVYDSTTARWLATQPARVRAFQIATESGAGFNGWIDEQGRILETRQFDFDLRRLPYELAFSNWRLAAARGGPVPADRDIMESSAIAANKTLGPHTSELRVRLSNVNLQGFDLDGVLQHLAGDTLLVTVPPPGYDVARKRNEYPNWAESRPEPLIQSDAPEIKRLALGIAGKETDARVVAAKINDWVHDRLKKRVTFGVPSALSVLRSRSGDCNDHTQLFVALARAAGIPARVVSGLAYVDGKFYYHAWAEILPPFWIPVDPTFGQIPADAAHLRFVIGGLTRQTELLRLMGNLKIDILEVRADSSAHGESGAGRRTR